MRNAEALAEAMTALIQQPAQVPAMGLASRRLVEDRFDVHKVNQSILETLGIDWPEREPPVVTPEDETLSRRAS